MEVKTHRSVGRAVAVLGAAAGLLIAAAPAMANTVQITGSMEGAIQISNGDHVAAGYQFSVQGAHPAMTVQMANASVVFQGKCSNGGTDTLTVPLSAGPYQIAANDNGPHPGTNEQQPVSFQGSVTANVCGGTGTLDASSGATFSADLQSDVTTNQVQVQFHYRDPAAKGKGNYDCMASSSASLGSDVCGASWSGAVRLVPDALPATPVLATSASSGVVGQSIQDVATLSGGNNPTGTITWKLYGPGDSTCSSAIRTFTDSTISGDGNYTSPSFATTNAGTYRWVASYGGDSNNVAVSGKCNDAGENSTVTPASPGIVTRVTPSSATVGDVIKDTATLSGGDNPTGSITWHLYSDPGCTSLVDTITVPVNGDATYTVSPGFTTSAPGVTSR